MESKKTIGAIKKELEAADITYREKLAEQYRTDPRAGVKKLIRRYDTEKQNLISELERLEIMREFEHKYQEYEMICGIDEVGRGPLAGPVMAGALILPKNCHILYMNDSKKLSAAMREKLFDEIMEKAVATGIGIVSPAVIDQVNILNATYEAMRQAIGRLSVEPDILLNDAVHIPEVSIKQISIVKGDARSVSIAGASIIAKVTRDRMMQEYDRLFPEYQFAQNKGYGSAAHIEALRKYGPCPIHRKSFIKNFT